MVTGDHPGTARAIAAEVGLLGPEGFVLEGHDLPGDEAALGALLDRDGVVVSRVTPEDKLRIAKALRARGHVVAMTGDGVNDGPALQAADIGIAMGRGGTDVAREASDLVLLDDDFATIVAAVTQGRATYSEYPPLPDLPLDRQRRRAHAVRRVGTLGGAFPLALGVLQVLFLDVVTDQIPALALGIEPPGTTCPTHPPRGERLLDRAMLDARLWRTRPGRGVRRDGGIRRRDLGRRPASGRTAARDGHAPGSLGSSLRGGRYRPGSERLRLPRHGQMGRSARLDDEPTTARRCRRRDPAPRPHALRGAGRDAPWPGGTNGARLGIAALAAPAVLLADAAHKHVMAISRRTRSPDQC